MRMWMVDPKLLCTKHLLGEHVECHMFLGTIKKGRSLKGYLVKGLVEVHNIKNRHDALAEEMVSRKMSHKSPIVLEDPSILKVNGVVDVNNSKEELKKRCSRCRDLIAV